MHEQIHVEVPPDRAALALVPHAQVLATEVEDEIVLLDLRSGLYFSLNRVGAFVWRMLNGENDLGTIHRSIGRRFAVAPATSWSDLVNLADELLQHQLVREA